MFSVNVVYARLMNLLDPEQVVAVARAAGITTPLEPLPSLALGTQEVTGPRHGFGLRHLRRRRPAHRPHPGHSRRGPLGPGAIRSGAHHPQGDGARHRRAGDRRPHRGGAPRHRAAGQDRAPGGRQDRYHRGAVRRLVRGLHARDLGGSLGGLPARRPPPGVAPHPLHHHRGHLAGSDLGPFRHRRPVGHPLPRPAGCRPRRPRRRPDRPVHRLPRRPPLPPGPRGHHLRRPRRRAHRPLPHPQPRRPGPALAGLRAGSAGTRPGRGGGLARGFRLPGHRGVGRRPGAGPRHSPGPVPGRRQPPRARRRGGAHRGRARSPARPPPMSSASPPPTPATPWRPTGSWSGW